MRPQKQRHLGHDGTPGDCHRTCIAMILNMDRDDVPHFMAGLPTNLPADDPLSLECTRAEVDWLSRRGLAPVSIPFPGTESIFTVINQANMIANGAPLILGCSTANGNHSVVICDGRPYNPNDAVVTGPMADGYWWLTIYSVGQNWRSPRLLDRLRAWLL